MGNRIILPTRIKKDDFRKCIKCNNELTRNNRYKYQGYVHSICRYCKTEHSKSYARKRKKALEGSKWF